MRCPVSFMLTALFCGAIVHAQTPKPNPVKSNSGSGRPDPVVVRDVGTLPSYKDLKFAKLGEVKVPKPETFTLSNGMKVFLLPDHELPLVNGRVLVRTGNLFDPKEKRGLASITGVALRSGGTKDLTGDQLDTKLENLAASVESNIGESNGSVSFAALKDDTDTVLALFRDVLAEPAFREDKIELAKTQEKSAISRRNDSPNGIAQRKLYSLVYGPDTPYGGEEEYDTINAISRDDVTGFYKRYFFPSNLILSVYGDFDSTEMKRKLENVFGSWKVEQPKTPPFPKVDAELAPGIYLVSKKDVTQTFIEMGHLGGQLNDKDFAALSVAADVFGGGFSSRLFREIRTRLGYAYSVGADWGANYDHPGVFRIGVSTKTQTTAETLKSILKVLDGIRSEEITDDELKIAKDSVLNSLVFAFERPSSTLARLVTYDYFGYPADFLTQYQKALEAVTKADVLRVAKQYFQPSKLTIIAVGNPDKFGEPLTTLNIPVKPLDVSIPPPHEATATASAETLARGKELITKAMNFLGGEQKLKELKDITQLEEAQVKTPQGDMTLNVKAQGILPGTFRQEQQRGPAKIIVYVDPQVAWVSSPRGIQDLPAEAQKQIRSEVSKQIAAVMQQIPQHASDAVAMGEGKVQFKNDAGELVTLEVNASTGAIESITAPGEEGPETQQFSDWRDVSGLKFPFKAERLKDGKPAQSATTSEIKINTNLKPEELSKRP